MPLILNGATLRRFSCEISIIFSNKKIAAKSYDFYIFRKVIIYVTFSVLTIQNNFLQI